MNRKLSLTGLLDLQKEVEELKVKKQASATLDQIPMLPTPKKRGGYRGGHRQKGGGSTVMRIPNDILSVVTQLIEAHKTGTQSKPIQETKHTEQPDLSVVTEFKQYGFHDKYINPKNPEEHWSGLGRKPMWIYEYMSANNKVPAALLNPNPTKPITRSNSNELA